jgi:hypothetical protein
MSNTTFSASKILMLLVAALPLALAAPDTAAAQGRRGGSVGLTVFTDPDFRGESATFRDDISDLRSVRLNDEITSLFVARGETWEVCEDANFSGRCQVVTNEESDLRPLGWNDRISSVRRLRGGRGGGFAGGIGRGAGIELYERRDFRGGSRAFDEAIPNLRDAGFNDQAMSVRLGGRQAWEVCVDANYRNCRVIDASTSDLSDVGMSSRISSLRPWNQGNRRDDGFGQGRPGFPRAPRLVLFDQRNFRGQSVTVDQTSGNLGGFGDRAESVQVEGGTWEICTDAGFRGRCTIVSEDTTDLGRLGLRNNVGSARPVRNAVPR